MKLRFVNLLPAVSLLCYKAFQNIFIVEEKLSFQTFADIYLIFLFTNMQKSIVKNCWSSKIISVGIVDPLYYKAAQRAELC